jgi:hypothetical protein
MPDRTVPPEDLVRDLREFSFTDHKGKSWQPALTQRAADTIERLQTALDDAYRKLGAEAFVNRNG